MLANLELMHSARESFMGKLDKAKYGGGGGGGDKRGDDEDIARLREVVAMMKRI